MSARTQEPLIHSGVTDVLPEDHPLAYTSVCCDNCSYHGTLLHYAINENMQTWVEILGEGKWQGNFCLPCFALIDQDGDWIDG